MDEGGLSGAEFEEEAEQGEVGGVRREGSPARLVVRPANFRGNGEDGFPTGPELIPPVACTSGDDMPDIGAEAAELMGMYLDPKSWKDRALYMRAVFLFMQKARRDFPLDEISLAAFLGFLYDNLLSKKGS